MAACASGSSHGEQKEDLWPFLALGQALQRRGHEVEPCSRESRARDFHPWFGRQAFRRALSTTVISSPSARSSPDEHGEPAVWEPAAAVRAHFGRTDGSGLRDSMLAAA